MTFSFTDGFGSFVRWLGQVVEDNKTHLPSSKRVGFMMAVTVLCAVMGIIGGVIAGVTLTAAGAAQVEMVRIIAGTLEIVSGLVLTAVTTGYVAGKAVEKRLSEPEQKKDS